MKTIDPISTWANGVTMQASVLEARAVGVNLGTSATFYYSLMNQSESGHTGDVLAQGNLTMAGPDYEGWNLDEYAWDWVAKQLNVTITGEYIIPVIEPFESIGEPSGPAEGPIDPVEEPAAV